MTASGAAVATTLVHHGRLNAFEGPTEIEIWQQYIDETFVIGRAKSLRQSVRPTLRLAGIEVFTTPDPNRPTDFRTPFTLYFVPGRRGGPLPQQGNFRIFHPVAGRFNLFLNETLKYEYSDRPVMQAVFG